MRWTLLIVTGLLLGGIALGAVGDRYTGSISSQVTTAPTEGDGVRHSAESGWTVLPVPANCVIIKDRTVVHELSANGSEYHATVEYDDYVEVVPGTGIQQPRTIKVKTFARGPRGAFSGRGWLNVRVDFQYVQFKP